MAESKLPAKSDRKSHRRTPGDPEEGIHIFTDQTDHVSKQTGQVEVLMTCNLASLSGAMYHGFEGAISTFGVYFPYLNLALKWSNEPGPPH